MRKRTAILAMLFLGTALVLSSLVLKPGQIVACNNPQCVSPGELSVPPDDELFVLRSEPAHPSQRSWTPGIIAGQSFEYNLPKL